MPFVNCGDMKGGRIKLERSRIPSPACISE